MTRTPEGPARAASSAGADDAGMTTAEYAVGMIAACGFAGVLVKLLASDSVAAMLARVVKRALSVAF